MTDVAGVREDRGSALRADLTAVLPDLIGGLEIVAARRLGDRDDARDAAQETLARLLERIRGGFIKSRSDIAPVAYGIIRHVIADMLRARTRTDADLADVPAPSASALAVIVRLEEVGALRRALAQLAPADRALLRRCFVNGERIAQIAQQLGESAARLRKRKSRALRRLAALLRGLDDECHTTDPMSDKKT